MPRPQTPSFRFILGFRMLESCTFVKGVGNYTMSNSIGSPDFLFFQIGSNDLCTPTCQPEALADSILRVPLDLAQASGVHLAFVGQITKRAIGTYMSAEAVQAFEAARLRANHYTSARKPLNIPAFTFGNTTVLNGLLLLS